MPAEEFFDNPVTRFLLRPRTPYWRQMPFLVCAPLALSVVLFLLLPIYDRSRSSIMTIGQCLFVALSGLYFFHVMAAAAYKNPLSQAVRDLTAEQVVLTGITPAIWMRGILDCCLIGWLTVTPVYIPLFYLCWGFGGVSLAQPLVVPLIVLWCAVSCGFLGMLMMRHTPLCVLMSALLILSFICLGYGVKHAGDWSRVEAAGDGVKAIVACLMGVNPIGAFMATFNVDGEGRELSPVSYMVRFMCYNGEQRQSLIIFFTVQPVLWLLAFGGIILGPPRRRIQETDLARSFRGRIAVGASIPAAESPQRALSLEDTLRLFHQNGLIRHSQAWEWVGHSVTAIVVPAILCVLGAGFEKAGLGKDCWVAFIAVGWILSSVWILCFHRSAARLGGRTRYGILAPAYVAWTVQVILLVVVCRHFAVKAGVDGDGGVTALLTVAAVVVSVAAASSLLFRSFNFFSAYFYVLVWCVVPLLGGSLVLSYMPSGILAEHPVALDEVIRGCVIGWRHGDRALVGTVEYFRLWYGYAAGAITLVCAAYVARAALIKWSGG